MKRCNAYGLLSCTKSKMRPSDKATHGSSLFDFIPAQCSLNHAISQRRLTVHADSGKTADASCCHQVRDDVLVYLGEETGMAQPDTFRLCPLGLQFYTSNPMDECRLVELTFTVPADDHAEQEKITCTGLVAQCCEPDNGQNLYRVWVKFLDVPESTLERLKTLCTGHDLICPYCSNYKP